MRRVCEPALAVNVRIAARDGLERERPEQDGYRRWGVHLDVMSGREQEEVRVGQQLVEAGRNAEAGSRRWQALGSVAAVVAEYRNHNEADVSTGRTRTSECRGPSRTRGAGCLQGARRSFRSPDPRRVPIRRVPCLLASLQAANCARMARDRCRRRRHRGEDRGIGIRPLAASWPSHRRTAEPERSTRTVSPPLELTRPAAFPSARQRCFCQGRLEKWTTCAG